MCSPQSPKTSTWSSQQPPPCHGPLPCLPPVSGSEDAAPSCTPGLEGAPGPRLTSPPLAYSITKQRRSWVWKAYFSAYGRPGRLGQGWGAANIHTLLSCPGAEIPPHIWGMGVHSCCTGTARGDAGSELPGVLGFLPTVLTELDSRMGLHAGASSQKLTSAHRSQCGLLTTTNLFLEPNGLSTPSSPTP